RDTHETQRGRHAAGDIAAQQRVEETDPERGDEDRKGTTKEGTRRYTDERDRRRLRDEHERRRDRIDRDEQREHEHERRRDLREWMRVRERCARVGGERLEQSHAARPPRSSRRSSANASTKSSS